MSKFSDRLGINKPKEESNNWIEVNVGVTCPTCNEDPSQVWYDKSSKKLKLLCEEGHEDIIEMDLSWLIR